MSVFVRLVDNFEQRRPNHIDIANDYTVIRDCVFNLSWACVC